jgi:outer membrane immunogenic protein
LVGWTVGGGLEWAVTQSISVKAEYLFVDLGHVDISTPVPTDADVDETHIVRAGINFQF